MQSILNQNWFNNMWIFLYSCYKIYNSFNMFLLKNGLVYSPAAWRAVDESFWSLESMLSINNELAIVTGGVVEPLSASVTMLESVSKTTSLTPMSQAKDTTSSIAIALASKGPRGS